MLKLFQPESWMSKLLMVSLGLLFSNQRSGLVRTGGWEPLERVGKGRVGRRSPKVEGTLKIWETFWGKENGTTAGKGWEVRVKGTWSRRFIPPALPPPLYIFMASDPDWSHYVRTFKLKNQFYLFVLQSVCFTPCVLAKNQQESSDVSRGI